MDRRKTIIIILATFIVSSLFTFVITYKLRDKIESFKNNIYTNKEDKMMYENIEKIKSLNSLIDEEDAWYTKYHFISHSGGV